MSPEEIMWFTSSDLLQANATLIAGILILLTITIVSKQERTSALILIFITPVFFVFSIIVQIYAMLDISNTASLFGSALILFIVGLLYLVISIGLVAVSVKKN